MEKILLARISQIVLVVFSGSSFEVFILSLFQRQVPLKTSSLTLIL